jgi:signal transduction histidine kinase
MDSKHFVTPVDMRKRLLPAVTVYGDTRAKELTKLLYSLIPGQDVRFTTPETEEALIEEAYNSAIVFVLVTDPSDANIQLADKLSNLPGVVADIIAITPEQEIRRRLHMLTYDFDNIFNWEILNSDDFRSIFNHKLKKGIMRLNARIQEDEYQTFRGFLSVSPDAFIVFDRNKRLLFVSQHYHHIYRESAHLFVRGTPVQVVFDAAAAEMGLKDDDPRYHDSKNFWASLQGQMEFQLDNGKVLRNTAAPLPDGAGTIVTTTDITLYKTQEKALAEKQAALSVALANEQEASKLQKQFISMVSHEFRTPLSIVDGNAQIIERRGDALNEEERRKRLKTIRSAVSRLVNMMEAVLSSNMLQTGNLDLYPEAFDLGELTTELCQEQNDLASSHKIICTVTDLPKQTVLDRKIVTLILTNLLSNAVKFTQVDPLIEVSGFVEGNAYVIQVADNGIGIPAEELPNIFNRFYRATTSGGIPGSGVGLALVKDLANLHGGTVNVQSTVGKGTTFEVRFPRNLVDSTTQPRKQQAS